MKKAKLLSLLSLIVLSTGIICAAKVQIDDLYYNLNDADLTAEVALSDNSYDGLTDVIIPASVSYNNIEYSVTSIGSSAFAFCNTLTSVEIPSSVTSIGTQAFATCPYLKSVVIPSSVTIIGNQAFMACDILASITIPDGVTSIGNYTFHNCLALTTIDIPSGVTSIGKSAFDNCLGFTSITCRAVNAPELGTDAFNRVDKSIPVYVPAKSVEAYRTASGWSEFTNIQAITGGASGIIASGTCGAEGSNLTWELSDGGLLTISGTGAMASYDYDGCSSNTNNSPWYDYKESILSVVIENGVTNIGQGAFAQCSNVTSIDIPVSVTGISNDAFVNCSELTTAPIGEGVVTIEWNAYEMCSGITSVTIPASVQTIGSWAFVHCSQSWAGLCPESGGLGGDGGMPIGDAPKRAKKAGDCGDITVITSYATTPPTLGQDAFNGTDVNIPVYVPSSSVAAYQAADGWSAFTNIQAIPEPYSGRVEIDGINYYLIGSTLTAEVTRSDNNYEGLTEANIPATVTYNNNEYSVTSIGDNAFSNCSGLTSLTISIGVTSVRMSAFYNCTALTSVDIPSSVTSIELGAFGGCTGLTSITIPSGVTSIGQSAFSYCSGLTSITIPSSVTNIGNQAFFACSGVTSMSVDAGNPKYDSRNNCNAIIETATNTLLFGCPSTIIPSSVTSIESSAFNRFSNLTSVDIPSSITSIGSGSFAYCTGLTSITIPSSVTSIGRSAFAFCPGLTSMTVEAGNPVYDSRDNCNAIIITASDTLIAGCQNTVIPSSVTSIDVNAFGGCSGLLSIDIPSSITSIGEYAFQECTGLTSVTIPSSITSFGASAFYNCTGLTSVTIENGITTTGWSAFYGCSSLTSIELPSSITSLADYSFSNCSGLTSITCRAMNAPELGYDVFTNVDKSIPLYVPSESIEAYQTASGWSEFTNIKAIPSGGGEVQIAMAVAANQWTFICLPPLGDRQYTQDMFTYDGLTGVQWGTYNGAKRAAGQSGWETPETFNAQQGYIIYSTTAGTLRIDAYEDDIRQGETADSISTPLSAYDSDQPANTGWNILGNPYNQGFPISAFAAAGIESPITVWNGTGYTTYTPGIDDYTLQPLEAFFIQKAEGGAERITFRKEELERDVEGALSGYFTVGESTRVRFSQGNLQYQASTDTWQFAENQYDYLGDANSNISSTYDGWIDLFGFGTGDNPTKSISNYSDYSTFTDWGVNAISNGGNEANLWRTLTTDEWLYLFYSRTDAANLFGLGSVNGVSGLIILPDNWTTPQGASFTPSTTQGLVDTGVYFSNTNGDNFSHNTYTAEQWLVMEQSGAVFLPVTGYRWGTGMDYVGTTGYYWSTTPYNEGYGRSLYFNSNYFYPQGSNDRFLGLSVRLVR